MLRVGLTGGIACGKTAVVGMLRELGCPVLEADPLAHRLVTPGQPAYDEIVAAFGRDILTADGAIDRMKLGAIVFRDAARRAELNRIVHPRVIAAAGDWFTAQEEVGEPLAVFEAALLLEAGHRERFDCIVAVWCPPEQQRERLRARGLDDEQIEQRLAAQMSAEEKRRRADHVIDTSGPVDQTRAQVAALVARLKQLPAA
jgi:dephospho-CoA kinase